jgi:menaquinol-cytochrome c reductase iron-sulfur subunit
MSTEPQNRSRRSVLGVLAAVGAAAASAVVGVPAVAFVVDPLLRRARSGAAWRRVLRASALRPDAPVTAAVRGDRHDAWTTARDERLGSVFLQKNGDAVSALSTECPHLGCTIRYDEARGHFKCPCHASSFDRTGKVLSGPAKRAMDPLDVRVRDEQVEVRFVRFRPRISTREEIG